MVDLYFSPRKAFQALVSKPRWLVPFILSVAFFTAYMVLANSARVSDFKKRVKADTSLTPLQVQMQIAAIETQAAQGFTATRLLTRLGLVAFIQALKLFLLSGLLWLLLLFFLSRDCCKMRVFVDYG